MCIIRSLHIVSHPPYTENYMQVGVNNVQYTHYILIVYTRSTHAYDASRRSMIQGPCAGGACGKGVRRFSFRASPKSSSNVKSEPKIPGCDESPVRAFYC